MILSDIRLTETTKNKCSPAKLSVNERQIACNKTKADFGSIFIMLFYVYYPEHMKTVSILVKPNSKFKFPDEVLFTLKPEGKHVLLHLTECFIFAK